MIVFILILFWQPFLGDGDSYAVTHRLSEMICTSYSSKNFGKVSPDSSSSSKPCAVAIKSGNSWEYKSCRSAVPRSDTGGSNYSNSEDTQPGKEPKIQKGWEAEAYSYPFIVYVTRNGSNRAGESHGIIYNQYTIIASNALPINWTDSIRVQMGKHDVTKRENSEQLRFICDVSVHPNNITGDFNSFHLIHLYDPITFNDFVRPASLYQKSGSETISNECYVAGWGKLEKDKSTNVLNEVKVNVTSDCDNKPGQLCTPRGGPNVYCYGDVGGPLVCSSNGKMFVRGVNAGDNAKDCKSDFPTYFFHFNKSHVIDWVESEYQKRLEKCRPECSSSK
ncbi:unnamed protein product [Allacma fusca]|uniref:Peptidase S1 domain-containing protein n=1 Tax=Allacma fusca TaxID=39272 RepID=A0A8J2L2E9_9HEXA|nr:unnamed protein product [Allacma fusca]